MACFNNFKTQCTRNFYFNKSRGGIYKNVKDENIGFTVAFYLLLVAFIILGVVRNYFSILAFACLIVYILFAKANSIFLVLFFLLPFAYVFKLSPSSASLLTYAQLIAVVKLLLLKKTYDYRFVYSWLFLLAYIVLGSKFNITVSIKQAVIIPMVYLFFSATNIEPKKFILTFSNGLILSSFIAQFNDIIPNMTDYIVNDETFELGTDVVRFSGLYSDPNYYSIAVIIALVAVVALSMRKDIGVSLVLYYILFAYFGALTVSKSFLLLLAFASVFVVVALIKNGRFKTLLIMAIAIAILIFIGFTEDGLFANTIERLLKAESGEGLLTNRDNIWDQYINYFKENPFNLIVGSGIGANTLKSAAHNTYIDFIYYYGIIGTVLFIYTFVCAVRNGNRSKKNIMNFIPIICAMVNFFFLSCLQYYDFTYILIICVYVLKIDFTSKKGISRKKRG